MPILNWVNIEILGQKKVVFFLEINQVKNFFFNSPAQIVKYVSEYIFLISKKKQINKKNENQKK